jgi:hypothetical protein
MFVFIMHSFKFSVAFIMYNFEFSAVFIKIILWTYNFVEFYLSFFLKKETLWFLQIIYFYTFYTFYRFESQQKN